MKLNEHEGDDHKGHTIERHVGKDKTWLQERVKELAEKVNNPAASSYRNLEEAEKVTEEVIKMLIK